MSKSEVKHISYYSAAHSPTTDLRRAGSILSDCENWSFYIPQVGSGCGSQLLIFWSGGDFIYTVLSEREWMRADGLFPCSAVLGSPRWAPHLHLCLFCLQVSSVCCSWRGRWEPFCLHHLTSAPPLVSVAQVEASSALLASNCHGISMLLFPLHTARVFIKRRFLRRYHGNTSRRSSLKSVVFFLLALLLSEEKGQKSRYHKFFSQRWIPDMQPQHVKQNFFFFLFSFAAIFPSRVVGR